MEIRSEKLIFYYLLSLKDVLLREGSEFVEESIVREYNRKILELGKFLDLNLDPYKIKEEDRYFNPEDIEYPTIGFLSHLRISNTDSTIATEIIMSKDNLKYRKLNFLQKLDQVLLIFREFNKNSK